MRQENYPETASSVDSLATAQGIELKSEAEVMPKFASNEPVLISYRMNPCGLLTVAE